MDDELKKYFDVDERREEARLNIGAEIFLEKSSPEPGEQVAPEVVRCEAVDISANGLQVVVDCELTAGAIHTIIVDIYRNDDVYRLSAEIRWIEPHKNGYLVGLSFFDSACTGIIDWKLMMAKNLN